MRHHRVVPLAIVISVALVAAAASSNYRTWLTQGLFLQVDGTLVAAPDTGSPSAGAPSPRSIYPAATPEKPRNETERQSAVVHSGVWSARGSISGYIQTPASQRGLSPPVTDSTHPNGFKSKSVTSSVADSHRYQLDVSIAADAQNVGPLDCAQGPCELASANAPTSSAVVARTSTAAPAMSGMQTSNDKGRSDPAGMQGGDFQNNDLTAQARVEGDDREKANRKPREERLRKARSFKGDIRNLRHRKSVNRERAPREKPQPNPTFYPGPPPTGAPAAPSEPDLKAPAPTVQAPSATIVFEGLDRENWGAGSPPDTTGDVGPTYYVQSVNTSVGIYRKSDGFREAAFTFNTLMGQGNFGNLCDTDNFGDPVVLYDTFEDRWILTDFAFATDVNGNVLSPAYQCFAVSMNGNPITGGWNFYSIQVADLLNDYPKLGIWTDGLYMSANMFSFGASSTFQGVRVWAFNKAQMYAGSPTVKVVSINLGTGDFTIVPANARLQTGTPPAGRPNFFLSTWNFTNAVSVYKFHVDWNRISLSTFTGPEIPIAATSWPNAGVANAPQSGTATLLDVLQIRAMVQNQYTNFGGTESLWVSHTVRRGNTSGFAAPRWYQVNMTGGTVAANLPQAASWDPDAANVIHRFMPSLALDRGGNMAMGYTTSSSTTFPSLRYAGRLSTDPVNTFGQTEQILFTGTASQTGSSRWGDYSSMMLDPDGCTFWYTNEYANPLAQTSDKRWMTKIGSFKFAECTTVGAGGTVSGTVTDNATSNPISGATVALGNRTTTTDASGVYTFLDIPAGTYPSITASFPGYGSSTATSIVVADTATTTQNFSLTAAPTTACLTDTTQADFLLGVSTNVDLNTSPGDVTLIDLAIDQQNTAGTTTGTGFGTPAWTGQTFTPTVNGQLVAADIQVFCNGCGATPPNLTLSVRNTAAGLPTGADLASVTIPGSVFSSGATVTFTASFGSPATLTSGTQYALILRPVSVPAGSGYFWIRSSPSTYASGSRVLSANSGGTWSTDTTRDYNFKAYMRGPYSPTSGNLVSDTRDANPAAVLTPIWSTFSWNATTPASTSLKFQLAGSNSVNGPFNFVGPDGTAATFFTTSPASLDQFYGLRYLQYKAFFSTTNSAVTPTLHDVTICFEDLDCSGTTPAITPTPSQVCSNSSGNTASGPDGMTVYAWSIANGTITSSTTAQSVTYTAGASGDVTLTLTVTTPSGCITPNSLMVPINPIPATPTITPDGPTTFCDGGSVTLTSSSASGNQWFLGGNPIGGATNQQYIANASGDYTVVVTELGCSSASSTATTVTVNPIPATPTITPDGPTRLCPSGSVTLTSSSASGNQWYLNGNPIGGATNQSYIANTAGDYTVTVTTNGCPSASSTATGVTGNIAPALAYTTPQSVTVGGSLSVTPTTASDEDVTYQVLTGHGLTTAPTVNASGEVSITNAQPVGAHTVTIRVTDDCDATTDAMFTLNVVSPANVSGTKTVSGAFGQGDSIIYTVTLSNSSTSAQLDNPGNEFTDVLPSELTLVSANASSGMATATVGTNTVTWNGAIAGSGSVSITITASINSSPEGTVVSNQGTINYDADGNGTNEANRLTDDPGVGGASDPTNFTVTADDLTITKTHSGNFSQGQIGATYTITVNNIGSGPTDGSAITVTDNVPVGLIPTGPVGVVNGWFCSINSQMLTCTRSDVLSGSSSYLPITLTVNVANPAPLTVTNTATVTGGGEVNTSNNSASDPTSIDCSQDFSLNNSSPLMISRFRMNGPRGPQDEFVEIFNPSTTAHTVASGNCAGGGYGVFASAGNGTNSNNMSLVCYIPNGTVITAGGYYLCTGAIYSLSNLGRNGGAEGATSVGDAPIGCNGQCALDIPDDAGLALMNVAQGVNLTTEGGFLGGVPDGGFILYDKVGFGPYGPGAPAPGYPSLAGNFCEGAACLLPVGDASTGAPCTNPTGLFPVFPAPPACYGLAGQYEFLRRQTSFDPLLGTLHHDSNNNANDFILVAPSQGFNMGLRVTGVSGVTALLGAAGPQNSYAPADFPRVLFPQAPFDGANQLGPRNVEREFALDPTIADPANNPQGTFALRLRFTNNSGSNITGLRFRIENISTLCGPQTATPTVGGGNARNLSSSPNCGTGSLTAILKLLNSAQEVVIDSTSTAYAIHGTVIEDLSASAVPTPPGAGPLSPKGGGLDSSFIVNPSSAAASVGDGVTGGTGVFATTIGTTEADKVLRIKIKFGVVRSGRFILLITPAAKTAP